MVRNLDVSAARPGYAFQHDAMRASGPENIIAPNILTGTVRLSGDTVRVTAHLVYRDSGAAGFPGAMIAN